MTTKYPGGLIRKTPPTITPPVGGEGGSAPGVWTLEQASYYTKQGTWPKPIIQGSLYVWGQGTSGRLGLGDTVPRSSPVQLGSDATWVRIANGTTANTAAIKSDGTLWIWGVNTSGQLGQGNVTNRSSPVQVGALTNWYTVCISNAAVAAIKTDGTLWAWGINAAGQLGQNDDIRRSSPVQIGSDTNWSSVAAEQDNAFFAIKTNGTFWAWGGNDSGQLGQNNTVDRSSPTQVGALTNWSYVSGRGDSFWVAVKTDGTLWTCGRGNLGQLAQSDVVSRSSPVQIGALTNWSRVGCFDDGANAIKTDGTLWGWGSNVAGQIGDNTNTPRSSPVQIGSSSDWSKISSGNQSIMALKTNGTLWSWGFNQNGQLGHNDLVARSSPTQIGSDTWKKIPESSSVALATCAIR